MVGVAEGSLSRGASVCGPSSLREQARGAQRGAGHGPWPAQWLCAAPLYSKSRYQMCFSVAARGSASSLSCSRHLGGRAVARSFHADLVCADQILSLPRCAAALSLIHI